MAKRVSLWAGRYSATIGVPVPGIWLKLLGDEIEIKGPQVMAGYWQRPDETAKAMTPDGFLKTGDIGVTDERGFFKIVDRRKDMILVSDPCGLARWYVGHPDGVATLYCARTYALTAVRHCGFKCSLPGMKPVTKAATTWVNNSVFHW